MNGELAIEAVRAFLEIDDTKYEYDEENYEFSFRFRIENCTIRSAEVVLLFIYNDAGDFNALIIMGYTNAVVPVLRKPEMEHFLFNLNHSICRGNWEISHYDEIMYKRYISIEGDEAVLTEEMLESGINGMIDQYEAFLNSILAVNIGASNADEELKKLFGKEENKDNIIETGTEMALGNNSEQIDPFIIFLPKEGNSEEGVN